MRIHILGASGSGTTTLGRALAGRLGCPHHDTDDFFWLPSDPPFEHVRPRDERCARLARALARPPAWVLSGCLCGWGDGFIPLFDLVVFLWLPTPARMARLRARERERYGAAALAPGGRLHEGHVRFMTWAAGYDEGGRDMRSRVLHETWLANLACPVLRLSSVVAPHELLEAVGAPSRDDEHPPIGGGVTSAGVA